LHRRYEKVIDKRFGHLMPSSIRSVERLYASLPKPADLTPEYVRGRFKGLSEATKMTYASHLRVLEEELGRELLSLVRLGRLPKAVKRSDLYSKKELDAIWAACMETRDLAMFMLLYEGGLRANELLTLRIEDIRPDKTLWWVTVIGKGAKPRPVPVLHVIPALQRWLEVHPKGEGPVFVSLLRPHKAIQYMGLLNRLDTVLERAGVRRRKRPLHLFRHTRLTELAAMGLTEGEMCALAGWEIGSAQTKVYVHLSGRDLKRSFGRIYGLDVEMEEPALKMESRKCPRCKKKNPPGARFCSQCSLVLDEEMALRMVPGDDEDTLRKLIRQELAELARETDVHE